MNLWLLLTIDFIIQEPVSSGVLLVRTHQENYNLWLVHLLFIFCTLFDIYIGYIIGSYIHKKYKDTELLSYLRNKLENLLNFIGKNGKVVGLIVFAPMIFPISALFIPWLGISLSEAFIYILIGEIIIWYGSEWLLALTTQVFVSNSKMQLYIVALIIILVSMVGKIIMKKINKKNK